jgi:hypothetical protein
MKKSGLIITAVLLLILILLPIQLANADTVVAPSNAWTQTYPGVVGYERWLLQTKDSGYLLLYGSGDSVFSLLKTDPSGIMQWNKSYTAEISGYGQSVIQTLDGRFAVAETYKDNYVLLKIDESGNQQWNRSYSGHGRCSARVIIQTQDGGYAILGTGSKDVASGESNVFSWLLKTNAEGTQQWTQTLADGVPTSIIQTYDGGYAIAQDPNFNLFKLSSNGTLEWSRTYVDRDMNGVNSVVQTSDKGFALGGWMWRRINGGNPYATLVKTDASGNVQWTQYYGVSGVNSMEKTADDGFVLGASGLIKTGIDGTQEWETHLSGYAIQTQDGGYAVAGPLKTNENTWVAALTKLNRDPAIPPITPTASLTPCTSTTPTSKENNSTFGSVSLEPILAFAAIAVVVLIVVPALIIKNRKRH